jgi:nitroreductase
VQNELELSPWRISALEFPGPEVAVELRLRFLVGYAVLAPSVHNSQPWLFKARDGRLELYADRTRALPVVDPHDRTLTIGCGAALFNLRIAARHFGYQTCVDVLPDPASHDLLASLRLGERKPPTHEENTLFSSITRRRTNRMPFDRTPVDRKVIEHLHAAAQAEGAWFHAAIERRARHVLAELIAEGDRFQFADKRFRRELASWIHSNRSHSRDGMPGYAHGHGDLMSMLDSFVIRTFDLGKGVAAKDQDLAEHSPALVVLGTTEDNPRAWLRAGQAMQHVLLHATAAGVSASFLNQAIEVENLRPRLAKTIGRTGFPQVLLRLGHGPDVKPTPRRNPAEVLRHP